MASVKLIYDLRPACRQAGCRLQILSTTGPTNKQKQFLTRQVRNSNSPKMQILPI